METIARQLSLLEGTLNIFRDINLRTDPERKRDLVAARRILSERLGGLEGMISDMDERTIPPETVREFRKRLGYLRTAIAYHQALWPAVRIDEDPEEYRRTAEKPSQAFREFIDWGYSNFAAPARGM